MAIRKIFTDDAECLYKVCRPVEHFNKRLYDLLDDMAETMYNAEGVGLAAPQVTYLMHDLKEKGWNVDPQATTVEEAAESTPAESTEASSESPAA